MQGRITVKRGLSKRVIVKTGKNGKGAPSSVRLNVRDGAQRLAEGSASRHEQIRAMTVEEREATRMMQENRTQQMDSNIDYAEEDAFNTMPMGDEGLYLSHAGGEGDSFPDVKDAWLNPATLGKRPFKYVDDRTRRDRTQKRNEEFARQTPFLVEAFLWHQHHKDDELAPEPAVGSVPFELTVMSLETFGIQSFHRLSHSNGVNEDLLRSGFLGSAPWTPAYAFSLRCLEDFRQGNRACPRFSIQAMVKKMCLLNNIPFARRLSPHFRVAFDVYLEILHTIDLRIASALQRDSKNWRIKNTCPACMYELEGEPALRYRRLFCIDGNNSLKSVDDALKSGVPQDDSRTARRDIWVGQAEVDVFEQDSRREEERSGEDEGEEACWEDTDEELELEGLTKTRNARTTRTKRLAKQDQDLGIVHCKERWTNAGPDSRKKMFGMYAASGIVASFCRHGFLLLLCDMIRSGERRKYPLAITKRLIEEHGDDIAIGYDIGCTFNASIKRSSLADLALKHRLRYIVNLFHGHAHNRLCQVNHLPLYIEGLGLEDFEGCERAFSASNAVAASTRLSTSFHRTQAIEQHFMFWDDDKYAELSNFLYNNYRQALDIIEKKPLFLTQACASLGVHEADFEGFLEEEKAYLQDLQIGPAAPHLQIEYVSALEELGKRQLNRDMARTSFDIENISANGQPSSQATLGRRAAAFTLACKKLAKSEHRVSLSEQALQISEVDRWTEYSEEWNRIKQFLRERAFRRQLDYLERLVVQRLMELTKLNISGTAYKMRAHIAQALKNRSATIRKAVDRFNILADAVKKPRIQYAKVVQYSFLGEFDLLRDSRHDVGSKVWSKPLCREAMEAYFKLKCARDEIKRLNVEVRRLATHLADERETYKTAYELLVLSSPLLASELLRRWRYRSAINELHFERLQKLVDLPGCTATTTFGKRLNRVSFAGTEGGSTGLDPEPQSLNFGNDYEDENEGDEEDFGLHYEEDVAIAYSDFLSRDDL